MRALSIRQPWAELILSGRKTIETRTWRTSRRGLIVIHAGWIVEEDICALYGFDPAALARGGLVGTVEVTDVFDFTAETWHDLRDQHCVPDDDPAGRVGWRLANPRRLRKLIPLRGLPGLFPLEPAVAALVERSLAAEKGQD
jgi:predicted transcriptional regulator